MTDDTIPEGRVDLMLDKLNRERIGPQSRLQCKVCWHIYDPAEGCPEWQIPPGTPFNDLPEYFTCPGCGNDRSAFILCDDDQFFD